MGRCVCRPLRPTNSILAPAKFRSRRMTATGAHIRRGDEESARPMRRAKGQVGTSLPGHQLSFVPGLQPAVLEQATLCIFLECKADHTPIAGPPHRDQHGDETKTGEAESAKISQTGCRPTDEPHSLFASGVARTIGPSGKMRRTIRESPPAHHRLETAQAPPTARRPQRADEGMKVKSRQPAPRQGRTCNPTTIERHPS